MALIVFPHGVPSLSLGHLSEICKRPSGIFASLGTLVALRWLAPCLTGPHKICGLFLTTISRTLAKTL